MLGLGACERGQAAHEGWLPSLPSLGQVSKRAKAPQAHCACWLPINLSHWKGPMSCMRQILREPPGKGKLVHQVNTDSSLSPVLVLRPLSKYFKVYWGLPVSVWGLEIFVVGRSQQGGASRAHQAKTDKDLASGRRVSHQKDSVCGALGRSPSFSSFTTQFLPLCL